MCAMSRCLLPTVPGSKMSPTKTLPIGSLWMRTAQAFVGLFFVTASCYKLFDAFFFLRSAPLERSMEWWINNKWPIMGMREVMQFTLQYHWMVVATAVFVISFQMVGGLLLFANVWRRFAASLILTVQISVLLGVFHGGIGFQTFVGISLWLAVFYLLCDGMTQRKWRLLTYWLVLYGLLILLHRYRLDDPWPSAFVWQFKHYSQDVMSVSVTLKEMILALGKHPFAPYLWASSWWIQIAATSLILTRFRMFGGIIWIAILIGHEWIWLNSLTSEGVLWILTLFTWLTFEDASREKWGKIRMLPNWNDIKVFIKASRKWLNAK